MGIFDSLQVSGSALRAERTRMDVIAQNIANVETTRATGGGAYRRHEVVLRAQQIGAGGTGVAVAAIVPDESPLMRIYRPGHPDADGDGYLQMPNVDVSTEMADMALAARAYEANAAALRSGREMIQTALSILT